VSILISKFLCGCSETFHAIFRSSGASLKFIKTIEVFREFIDTSVSRKWKRNHAAAVDEYFDQIIGRDERTKGWTIDTDS
jgi:hypothetical protein